jgi:hypothetical protein
MIITQRSYVWNNKDYKLIITLLNFQDRTKPTMYNSTCFKWTTWVNFTATTGFLRSWVVTSPTNARGMELGFQMSSLTNWSICSCWDFWTSLHIREKDLILKMHIRNIRGYIYIHTLLSYVREEFIYDEYMYSNTSIRSSVASASTPK